MTDVPLLSPERLRELGRARRAEALRLGTLEPLHAESVVLHEEPGPFVLHVARALRRKPTGGRNGRRPDPFVPPYEPSLHVGALPGGWHVLLNKYPVLPEHYLLVPERFEPQEAPLDEACFAAACFALEALDGLLFYNAGAAAGASQPHRHLQLVALPLHPGLPPVPLLEAVLGHRLPVRLAVAPTPSDVAGWRRTYAALLEANAWRAEQPYDLLATRRWCWLVPRRTECWGEVSVNALGFAGSLYLPDRDRLEQVRRAGPAELLRAVGCPDRAS